MGKRQGMLGCAPDIVPPIPRMARQPRRRRMMSFGSGDKALAVECLHDDLELLFRLDWIVVPDRDGTCKIAIGHHVSANLLPSHVSLVRLVGGVGIEDTRRLRGHTFGHPWDESRLLANPCSLRLAQQPSLHMLLQADPPRTPAILH